MPRASTSLRSATSAPEISFTVQVWKENSTYIGYVPELDVSSCGDSIRQVKTRLREAVGLFLEEASRLGTLEDILSEAGFVKHGNAYWAHRVLLREKVRLAVPLASQCQPYEPHRSPPYRKIVRIPELEGFTLARDRGDHLVFTEAGILRPVVVPRYEPLPVFIIKNVLRTARISRERYFALLEQV